MLFYCFTYNYKNVLPLQLIPDLIEAGQEYFFEKERKKKELKIRTYTSDKNTFITKLHEFMQA